MSDTDVELPIPDLEPRQVNVDQYHAYAPEKFELLDGFLFNDVEDRLKLLKLLFVNVGLREVVKPIFDTSLSQF